MKACIIDCFDHIVDVYVDGSMTIGDLKEKLKNLKEIKKYLKRFPWKKIELVKIELLSRRHDHLAKDDEKMSYYFKDIDTLDFYIIIRRPDHVIPEEEDNENGNKLNDSGDYASYYGI